MSREAHINVSDNDSNNSPNAGHQLCQACAELGWAALAANPDLRRSLEIFCMANCQ
jgi:hypothetical protein